MSSKRAPTTYRHVRALPPGDRRARKPTPAGGVDPASRATVRPVAQSSPKEELFVGRYRLLELLGRGGMGQVWSARDATTGREIAIKMVRFEDGHDPEVARGRFAREATLSKQLRGPAFVEHYGHGEFDGGAYAAMELLQGETLQERLKRVGRLTLEETTTLLKGVAAGLRVAHALQIVHRDLKPANVFFARIPSTSSGVQALDGRRESVRLLDFGIAKDAWDQARLTRPGIFLGSAHYMSPEQVRSSRDVDPRSDLWSLAVVLYRCLTGERPFGGDAANALARIVSDAAPRPSAWLPELAPLDRFFDRALAKTPEDRFQTVDELVDAFERARKGEAEEEDDFASVMQAIDNLKVSSPLPAKPSEPPPTVRFPAARTRPGSVRPGSVRPTSVRTASVRPAPSHPTPRTLSPIPPAFLPSSALPFREPTPARRAPRFVVALALVVAIAVMAALAALLLR